MTTLPIATVGATYTPGLFLIVAVPAGRYHSPSWR